MGSGICIRDRIRPVRPEFVIASTLHGLCLSIVRSILPGGCAKESLDEVEEQLAIEADGDISSAMPPKSQTSARHTVSQFTTLLTGLKYYSALYQIIARAPYIYATLS